MGWEIDNALVLVSLNSLDNAIWRAYHPQCHDHGLRHCPVCHAPVVVDPRFAYLSEGVQ